MPKLKKQIKESFFNPSFYFLPLLVFMVADEFLDLTMAWKISFPIAFGLVFYVYFVYNRMLLWHIILSVGYLIVGLLVTLFSEILPVNFFSEYLDEILVAVFLLILLTGRSRIEKISTKTLLYQVSMSNNVNELFRFANLIFLVVFCYLITVLFINLGVIRLDSPSTEYVKYVYFLTIFVIVVYEFIRVESVRINLLREEWLPVMDENGNVIGSIQKNASITEDEKYIHPIVRMHFVQGDMIFLRQRQPDDIICPSMWDATVSKHVLIGESIEESLKSTSVKFYNVEPENLIFLANFMYESAIEIVYDYLFVTCRMPGFTVLNDKHQLTKWWTLNQIEENLNSGIFTDLFIKEFEILKRSGAFIRESCDCECALKGVLKNKTNDEDSLAV